MTDQKTHRRSLRNGIIAVLTKLKRHAVSHGKYGIFLGLG